MRFSLEPHYGFRATFIGKWSYAVSQVCKGSSQPRSFALSVLARMLSTILGTASLMLHVVPARGFVGSFLQSVKNKDLLQGLEMLWKSLEVGSLGHSRADLALKHLQVGSPVRCWGRS